MVIPIRPLGPVLELVGDLGHDVTYAYEDLVFVNHNAFLFQLDDNGKVVSLYFNQECPENEADDLTQSIVSTATKKGLNVVRRGNYMLTEQPNDNLEIKFFETEV
ncbi:MAG: hypothetical protein HGB11_11525 [Chlorobiales bacterium]|nr:hypothetical protein [Chlorobiales bacterium]